jgi:hypothetical protein
MTDVRERVARVIMAAAENDWDELPELRPGFLLCADAALSASGHAEMREALEGVAVGNVDVSGTAIIIGYPKAADVLDAARAALKKANGET